MIHFDEKRLAEAKRSNDLWWEGKLGHPLRRLVLTDAYPLRETEAPLISQANCTDFSYTPDQVIDAIDARLGCYEFMGDAFPMVNFDFFGPGVLAAFCGAKLDNASGMVWFFPAEELPLQEIHVRYDPDNIYVQRIKALYRAGIRRWGNSVVLSMPDLGGIMDIAATFRGTENLLMDMYDEPEEVERLVLEIETAWYAAYDDLSQVLQSANMGYTDWSTIFSSKPAFVLQCDFSYMIGPGMFERFVLPTITRDCGRLENTVYHLDGIGELPHLDMLLSIERLRAIQWQYGAGQKPVAAWEDLYEKIYRGGKLMQITDNEHEINAAAEFMKRFGSAVDYGLHVPASMRGQMERILEI